MPGTPDKSITVIEGGPTALLVSASTGVVVNGLSVQGDNTGQPAGTTIYGVRAINGADVALENVAVAADDGVAGQDGAIGTTGPDGSNGSSGLTGGASCAGDRTS